MINATLSKRSLKELLLDCATKTAFSFDNTFDEQTDDVSMDSCLAPVLANIILTEFEKSIADDLQKTGTVKFYCRHVDETLVLIKPKDIPLVLNKLNSFDRQKLLGDTPQFLFLLVHRIQ